MTDTPYTPEDLDEAETPPEPGGRPAKPAGHGHAVDFDPGSPGADAAAML